MARQQQQPGQTLDAFLSAIGNPPPPENLGNIPESASPPLPGEVLAERPEDEPDEDIPPEPSPAPEPEPADEDEPTDDASARMQDLERRIEQQQRELHFLRAGAAPQQAAHPQQAAYNALAELQQLFQGFQVTPQDIETIIRDPAVGAQYLTNGMYAAAAAGAQFARQQLSREFQPYANQIQQSQEWQLNQVFYGRHPELQPYASLVVAKAAEVRGDATPRDLMGFVDETARRTREQLKTWGVAMRGGTGTRATVRRLEPPRGELSAGRRAGGQRSTSPVQRDLDNFMAATRAR